MKNRYLWRTLLGLAWTVLGTAAGAGAASNPAPLALRVFELRGAGQPLSRRWVDLDGNGKLDLVVVSGSASAPAGIEEMRVETLVAYLNVTPFFLDRRQVLLFRQTETGFAPWGDPLPLTGDTAAVDVADIDGDGRPEILFAAGYRLFAFARADAEDYPTVPRILGDAGMLLGCTRSFIPAARLAAELVKGKPPALMLATPAGLEIRRPGLEGKIPADAEFVLRSGFRSVELEQNGIHLKEPRPRVVDADADGTLDLFFQRGEELLLYRGDGEGRFAGVPQTIDLAKGPGGGPARKRRPTPKVEDIDGDGLLDVVRIDSSDLDDEDADDEKSKKRKDGPLTKVQVVRARAGFTFQDSPDTTVEIARTAKLQGAGVAPLRIDRDARTDLLVTRFAVSMWQIARFLVTKKISVQISFESMLQRTDGMFAPPRGKPFETKLTIDLKRGISGIPSGPQGDFNGDGITDLLEFTELPELRVHLTTPDGVFPAESTLRARLPRAPEDRALLDVLDIDGDGRSDVAFFNPDGAGFVATVLRSGP